MKNKNAWRICLVTFVYLQRRVEKLMSTNKSWIEFANDKINSMAAHTTLLWIIAVSDCCLPLVKGLHIIAICTLSHIHTLCVRRRQDDDKTKVWQKVDQKSFPVSCGTGTSVEEEQSVNCSRQIQLQWSRQLLLLLK